MNLEEYGALERVEREHWFYKGKRALVEYWIDRAATLHPGDTVADCGAGTGELVRELAMRYGLKRVSVVGIEFVEEARRLARERKGLELISGSILDLPLETASCAVTIALDVLEHVEEDDRAFSELLRVTKSGGIVIINVPASMSLWSAWDVSLGHFRRYSKQSFLATMEPFKNQCTALYFEYANAFAFLPILFLRKISHVLALHSRFEDRIPSPKWNAFFFRMFVGTGKKTWFHPPFGSSLFCVFRKQ